MKFKSATLLYNPDCGKKKAPALAVEFAQKWKQNFPGISLSISSSSSAEDFANQAVTNYTPKNLLILMGGDGTFSLGLSALFSQKFAHEGIDTPLALLPAGSGNSFLREFGIQDFASAQSLLFTALSNENFLEQDCAEFAFTNGNNLKKRFFINIWSLGLVSEINLLAGKLNKAYTLAALLKILTHKPYQYKIIADGVSSERVVNFIAVCNSKFTGGEMIMAPMANTSDGLLDAIIPSLPNRFALLGLFPKIFKGEHMKSRHMEHFTFKTLQIELPQAVPVMFDGEMDQAKTVEIRILPKSWKLLIPPA